MTNAPTTHGMLVLGRDDQPEHAHSIPLTGVDVQARIVGPTSRVKVRQSYRNESESAVEATYVFPLEESAAVCGFQVEIDGEVLHGRVEGRDEAFDQYDDAIAEGRTAFLLDQERPDIFTASVGNLLPGQEIIVQLEYVAEVPREGSALRWRLPTTVSPRYVPEKGRNADQMDDAERISPPVTAAPLPYRLTLRVEADLGTSIASVESPSHKTRVKMEGTAAVVELAGDEGLMDRDFVLLLQPEDTVAPVSGIQTGPAGTSYVGVSFLPEYEHERDPVEIVFVVDCSGSMSGPSIEQARKTLRLCLRSLEHGDYFNVIRFGSHHELYADKSVAYEDASLKKVDEWVQNLEADLGGTEMAQPIGAAYRLPTAKGLRRRIVLITDGQVGNEDTIIQLARKHAEDVAVFAFGIGYGASEYLVKGVARAGRGSAEMVYPGQTIDEKVLRHFHRMTGRALKDVELSWEGLDVEDVLPRDMPPVWAGEPVSFYGRVEQGERGHVSLSFELKGQVRRFRAEIEPAKVSSAAGEFFGGAVPVLWARRRIRELEESTEWTGRYGSQQRGRKSEKLERKRKEVEAQLVELGREFGLVSAATSYVLVDERKSAAQAETPARFVRVPGQLTRDWHGVGHAYAATTRGGVPSGRTMFKGVLSLGSLSHLMHRSESRETPSESILGPSIDASLAKRRVPSDPIDDLALQMTAEGYWMHTPAVFKVTGLTKSRARELAAEVRASLAEELVVTLAVIDAVEREFSRIPAQWKPLLGKAKKWLKRTLTEATPPPEGDWEAWIRRRLAG